MKSSLVTVAPLGIGTASVESLTSYLTRLASANYVPLSDLMTYLSRDASIDLGKRNRFNNSLFSTLNSGTETAVKLIKAVERRTAASQLALLTTLRWNHVIGPGILKTQKYFAPWESSQYERLLYEIKPVHWTEEGELLETFCNRCKKQTKASTFASKIGYCSHCDAKLVEYCENPPEELDQYERSHRSYNNRNYYIWSSRSIGELLAYTGATSGFSFSKSLRAHFEYFDLDNSSEQSKCLGVSKSCIRSWLADNSLPKIDEFLNVLHCFNVKPVEFFTQRHLGLGSAERTQIPLKLAIRPKKRRSKAELDHERTEELLNKALASRAYSRVSFRSLCENELKQSHGAVRNRYPEMAKEYCSKHLLFRSARSRVTTAGIKAEITEAAELCRELGMPTSKRNMIHFMKNPGVFRAEWTNDFVADLQSKA